MPNWLITGSSRGIGLEVVRQLLADPSNLVIATCRSPDSATALKACAASGKAACHILPLDVAREASMRASVAPVAQLLGGKGLDYLYNNAAITEGDDSAFAFAYDGLLGTLAANVAAPALLGELYLPLLEQGARRVIVNVTSGLASFGLDFGAKNATYTVSKTALNMLTYKQARARPDVIAFVVDPGWVKTDMGGEGAVMDVQDSAAAILKLVTSATSRHSGKFLSHSGDEVAW